MSKSHDTICHEWAHQHGTSGKGHNVFWEGDTIYSYGHHFPMARHVNGVVLLTTDSYSVSTSKHMSLVRRAISHMNVVTVLDVRASRKRDHVNNLAAMIERFNDMIASAAKRRSPEWRSHDLACAGGERRNAERYAIMFKLGREFKKFPPMPSNENLDALKIEQAKRAKVKRANLLKDSAAKIAKWRNGESIHLPGSLPDMLRLIEGNRIETSQGIKIDAALAPMIWRMINRVRDGVEVVIPRDIAGWSPVNVTKAGNLVVGCHNIAYTECKSIIEQLNRKEVTA